MFKLQTDIDDNTDNADNTDDKYAIADYISKSQLHHSKHNDDNAEIDDCFTVDDDNNNDDNDDDTYSFTAFELLDDDLIAGKISSSRRSELWSEYVREMVGKRDYQISRNLLRNLGIADDYHPHVDYVCDNNEDWKNNDDTLLFKNVKTFVIERGVYFRLLDNPDKFVNIVDAIKDENDNHIDSILMSLYSQSEL